MVDGVCKDAESRNDFSQNYAAQLFGMGGKGGIDLPQPAENPEPAPVVVPELPSADEPIEQLQAEDAELRELYGDVTLSGRSAKVTH